jgi:hypothetical protein
MILLKILTDIVIMGDHDSCYYYKADNNIMVLLAKKNSTVS